MDVLPAIDLRDGKVVRLIQGDYRRQIDYEDDPLSAAGRFEQAGASWIHVVDLDGARSGEPRNLPVISRIIRQTNLKVEVGGGIREEYTIRSLLDAGADRVVVGTKAVADPQWFERVVHDPVHRNHICLGLDARQGKLAVEGWTELTDRTPLEVAAHVSDWPLAAIIYTDIARDGMLSGPNVLALQQLAESSSLPVIAAGGISRAEDVTRLAALPIAGMIIGRALYEGTVDLAEALRIAAGAPGAASGQ